MGVHLKIPQRHNVLVCIVSESVLHFCHSGCHDAVRMAVTAKKTQKTCSSEKDSVTTKAGSPYQCEPKNPGSTPKYASMMTLWVTVCDSQFDDRYKTETWIIYSPGQKDLKELSHPPYEWYIKLGIRRHPFLLLEMDWFSLFVCLPRDTEPDKPLVSLIISQRTLLFLYLPPWARSAQKANP